MRRGLQVVLWNSFLSHHTIYRPYRQNNNNNNNNNNNKEKRKDILDLIHKNKKSTKGLNLLRNNTRRKSSVDKLFQADFVQPKSETNNNNNNNNNFTEAVTSAESTTTNKRPLTVSFLEKLKNEILKKQICFEDIIRKDRFSEVHHFPLFKEEKMWTTQFLQNASHNNNHHNMLVYLCAAPTGTGKTVLIPIFLLNAHWQRVAVKLTLTIAALQEERTEEGSHYCITSLEAFVQDFKKDSTVQIIVCQPTRFACREVAGYVGALLSSATRVGYAVSGDRTSTKETEIIFTTPAYLTELLFRPQRTIGLFAPTTIVLDEAHERKVPSDILFSFLKLMRETPHVRATYPLYRALQQIVVMSATMSMANAFQYFSNKENHHNPILLLNEAQRHLVREYKMKKGVLDDSINVDQLEYIQVVERQTLTDGLQKNNQSSENNYPIERYFIEDIQNFQFLQSKLLFDNDNNVGLRTEDGKHALQQLADCFLSTTNNNNNMHQNKNSIESKLKHFNFGNFSNGTSITQFVLFLVEALTVRFISNHPHPHNTPVGMILFLPGLSEIMSLRAQLEAKCAVDYYYPISETNNNHNNPHFMEPLLTLRYANHNTYFSVPILHGNLNTNLNDMIDMATNQHDQHNEVPPVFVILATNVAESSVTIPNLKIVLNFCLERSFVDVASQNKNKNHNSHLFSDSMMKIKTNHIISFSSLKQREGRVGRTGEGVAIHFITKDYYLNQNEHNNLNTKNNNYKYYFPPLSESASNIVLAAKSVCFHSFSNKNNHPHILQYINCYTILENLPSPLSSFQLLLAVEHLIDHELLIPSNPNNNSKNNHHHKSLEMKINEVQLSQKGKIIAALPNLNNTQHNNSISLNLFLYYALTFHCLEEAILIAAAMSVHTLFNHPNTNSNNANNENENGMEHFYRLIANQRKLMGNNNKNKNNISYFSEPLLYKNMLLLWYNCSSLEEVQSFVQQYNIHRHNIKKVDLMIYQITKRIIYILDDEIKRDEYYNNNSTVEHNEEEEDDHILTESVIHNNNHNSISLLPSYFPKEYKRTLLTSLLKLKIAAQQRVKLSLHPSHMSNHNNTQNNNNNNHNKSNSVSLSVKIAQWYSSDYLKGRWMKQYYYGQFFEQNSNQNQNNNQNNPNATTSVIHPYLLYLLEQGGVPLDTKYHAILQNNKNSNNNNDENVYNVDYVRRFLRRNHKNKQQSYHYILGTVHDRLFAAYMAAFSKNIIKSEQSTQNTDTVSTIHNNTHIRRMNRKIIHNKNTVENQEKDCCTVHVDLQLAQQHSKGNKNHHKMSEVLFQKMPKETLFHLLYDYFNFKKFGLVQLEKFIHNNYVILRFNSENEANNENINNNNLQLAPLGISVLTAAQNSLLQRIRISFPNEIKKNNNIVQREETDVKDNRILKNKLYFETNNNEKSDNSVFWFDGYKKNTISKSELETFHFQHLFPNDTNNNNNELNEEDNNTINNEEEMEEILSHNNNNNSLECSVSFDRSVNLYNGLAWTLTVPSLTPSLPDHNNNHNKEYYCEICHSVSINEKSFELHKRKISHLILLQNKINELRNHPNTNSKEITTSNNNNNKMETFTNLLHGSRTNNNSVLPAMTSESFDCRLSTHSYLNALQLNPHCNQHSTIFGVAGGVSFQSFYEDRIQKTTQNNKDKETLLSLADTILPYSYVGARHVWVYHAPSSNPSTLLLLAGLVASASQQVHVLLLLNETHTSLFGIRIQTGHHQKNHNNVLLQLDPPLYFTPAIRAALQEVNNGGMFPGLLQEEENENNNNVHHRSGLHWCLLPEEKEEYCCQPRHSSSHCRICHPFTDTVREEEYIWKTNSTLLLLLQEYIHGRQNRVNLSEFKSDLINKLSLYFVENNDYRNLEEYKRKAKALLFAYLRDYNNKSDYFDDYKQKTAEKRNEKILQLIGKKTAFSKKGKQNNNNQTVELSEEEVHTTLIEVLHSVGCSFRLPPRNIIYEYYKNKLENNDNNNNTIHYTLEVYFSPPPILPSVMPTKYYHGIMADYHKRRFCKRENRHNPSRVKEEETERLLF